MSSLTVSTTPLPMSGYEDAFFQGNESLKQRLGRIPQAFQPGPISSQMTNFESQLTVFGQTIDQFHLKRLLIPANQGSRIPFYFERFANPLQGTSGNQFSVTIGRMTQGLSLAALKAEARGELSRPILALKPGKSEAAVGWWIGQGAIDEPRAIDVKTIDWAPWFEKLEACRILSDGWNGYTAASPTQVSVDRALLFLRTMQEENCLPTRLAPSSMGGVAVTRKVGIRKVLVEFYNDGRVFALFSTRGGEMNVMPTVPNAGSFKELLVTMGEYLDG